LAELFNTRLIKIQDHQKRKTKAAPEYLQVSNLCFLIFIIHVAATLTPPLSLFAYLLMP